MGNRSRQHNGRRPNGAFGGQKEMIEVRYFDEDAKDHKAIIGTTKSFRRAVRYGRTKLDFLQRKRK